MPANETSFKAGNQAAVTHGLRSQAIRVTRRRELVQEIRDQVLTRWPHLADQEPLVTMLIDALSDVRQARDWLDSQGGPLSAGGRPYRAMDLLRARERDARELGDRLLISPREMARLGDAAGMKPRDVRQARAIEAQARLRAGVVADSASPRLEVIE